MSETSGGAGGFTLLDGSALVAGAAVASVHITEVTRHGQLTVVGWVFAWGTFAGIALTAAGPFVLALRRLWRRPPGFPRTGDRLWGVLGLPWVLTALAPGASRGDEPGRGELYTFGLIFGLGLAVLIAAGVVWKTWVMAPAEEIAARGPSPWTDRVGMVLAIAWPLQCAFGLVMVSVAA